jgi:hypothetical protein
MPLSSITEEEFLDFLFHELRTGKSYSILDSYLSIVNILKQ